MEACLAVEREIDKVISKFNGIQGHAKKVLEEIVQDVKNLITELNAAENAPLSDIQMTVVKQTLKRVKETVCRLATEHRELHGTVSRVGKSIDRNFVSDYAATNRNDLFVSPEKVSLINHAICEHYNRIGMDDVVNDLIIETDTKKPDYEETYIELNNILDCIKKRDLSPAIAWSTVHREMLDAIQSPLEFKLHRLSYIELVLKGPNYQTEAISYARTHFSRFASRHAKEIQNLMGMLLYVPNGLDTSPYTYMLDDNRWVDIYDVFNHDACRLLGIPVNTQLETCINAGCTAVPALLNIKQIMIQRNVSTMWSGKEELPIEIDLGDDSKFHSTFSCPILRQQSTQNNPPMRLKCGHVISRDALLKLSNGNKIKCPYCPVEQSPSDARVIYF